MRKLYFRALICRQVFEALLKQLEAQHGIVIKMTVEKERPFLPSVQASDPELLKLVRLCDSVDCWSYTEDGEIPDHEVLVTDLSTSTPVENSGGEAYGPPKPEFVVVGLSGFQAVPELPEESVSVLAQPGECSGSAEVDGPSEPSRTWYGGDQIPNILGLA